MLKESQNNENQIKREKKISIQNILDYLNYCNADVQQNIDTEAVKKITQKNFKEYLEKIFISVQC